MLVVHGKLVNYIRMVFAVRLAVQIACAELAKKKILKIQVTEKINCILKRQQQKTEQHIADNSNNNGLSDSFSATMSQMIITYKFTCMEYAMP